MKKIFDTTLAQIIISLLVYILIYSGILFFIKNYCGYTQNNYEEEGVIDLANFFKFIELISTTLLIYNLIWIIALFVLQKKNLINKFSFRFLFILLILIFVWIIASKLKLI